MGKHNGLGVKIIAETICEDQKFLAVLGDGCSIVSKAVAEVVHFWNLVQISYMSTSSALSNKRKFPYFFRVANPEQKLNYPRIEVLKYFNWTKVTTVHQSYQLYATMIEELGKLMTRENITITKQYQFSEDPKPIVDLLKVSWSAYPRIIFSCFFITYQSLNPKLAI
ncbi:gamma-aminobutyric acid type B receptor subunit 2-like isoform X2 [Gigantopelta aegis]|uniref:gamma-aminobutyric acid type B receptor subunit 2-like isoform X2 n=1 Tax=Gigantopelta aegis TaxID=1735272 RepID=UPI001B88AA08|nr:gamma-aminobutyric acid type B receptor subunit 2-like isoform X2 [Gigantopelta aegis]